LPVPVTVPSPVPAAAAPETAPPAVVPVEIAAAPIPAPRPSARPTPAASARPAAVTGILRLLVVPESRVSIDGTSLGLVSRRELPLSPGTHTVRVEHPEYQPLQRRVTVREDVTESLVIDLAEKGIRRSQ
jgi:hypothetical protein